ncbi:hypothetical protein BJ508DRAFT_413818 [Ascobolus immersus RN42]|uniref:Uncharacterized protein n=1 Tax=Ascobolus immersus RN42 TaxID=1160509 RepID=A0A3N4I9Y0_ASCIM|nr:hypothetical protein BJ508DRAFT_413818 [Ascobolus immersus RN42]
MSLNALAFSALLGQATTEYESALDRELLFHHLLEPLRPTHHPRDRSSTTHPSNVNAPITARPIDDVIYSRPSSPVNNNTTIEPKRLTKLQELERMEREIEERKLQIQRFGATWIRPPGVGKTWQVMLDEAAEREEEEADYGGDEEGGEVEEVDLDAEVPEAEEMEDVEGEEEEEGEEVDLDAEVPEGSEVGTEEGSLPEVDEEYEMEDEEEVDLDAGVPSAEGSRLYGSSEEEEDEEEEDGSDGTPEQYQEVSGDEFSDPEEDDNDRSPNQSHEYPGLQPHHQLTPRTPHPRLQPLSDTGLSELERSSPIPLRSSPVVEARSRHATATPHRTPAQRHNRTPSHPENSTQASLPRNARAPTAPPRLRQQQHRYQSSSPMLANRAPQRAQSHFQTPPQLRNAPATPGRRPAMPLPRGAGIPGAGRRGAGGRPISGARSFFGNGAGGGNASMGSFLRGAGTGNRRVTLGLSSDELEELEEGDSMEVDLEDSMNR